jgi:type IV pilus assembly protein PilP
MRLGNKSFPLLVVVLMFVAWRAFGQDPSQDPSQMPQGDQLQAPPPVGADAPAGQAEGSATPQESPLSSLMQPYEYLDLGRKDPFQKPNIEKPLPPGAFHGPVLPLQKYALAELQLIGIIWDVSRPRAMLKDPQGKVHILGPNAKIGNQNGYIAAIREGELVVVETSEDDGKLRSDVRIVKLSQGKDVKAR